ncbi:tryptophan synthase subunit alpha [Acidipropionibacterium acidipropionici]|uniref:Tryptophan synthase alpha chain n=1 Tax=Acidipropionibacterium acidipropionici TaxID=1748 RepID=A0AAC8YD94_9ACTN|nr:tryptophan synthase subunit alpha [Acidipropionibacterium acidipropionici]AMS04425.1 tryptophan synthase subunit alpha [Acidipropionibacterium acidipropionici]AOZ45920.1 tryptophan synthase subunit alpha [Acidipropionibacterium acidipropionici]AZP38064.1 tryptophan synthase subunit alpha [Acidipropionibacterium acidipropionici]MDN6555990.1 tryptophan synthase subunit alpha [Acidipropionibacterium acidipropionici]QCV94957.1 tryptophan synthase subunit alpha [Acidipropionibacterium acidipropi
MSSSGEAYQKAREQGRPALVGYLPVGHPTVDDSLAAMRALTEGTTGTGVDLVEIGLPYSDPMMDGTVIQHATTKALELGVHTRDALRAAETVAATGTHCVVMTYWNLVEHYGVDAFARDLAAAGGSGLITPDLTPDEADEWFEASDRYGLDRIFLVAPSSTDERLARTVSACRGWVYATSVMGVTGARAHTSSAAPELVARVKAVDPEIPVGVGLGVSNGDQAAELGAFADGVIVGSALVRALVEADESGAGAAAGIERMRGIVDDLVDGVRRARPVRQAQ